jgi:hypothetical protein
MNGLSGLITDDEPGWIAALPSYQASIVLELRAAGLPLEEVAHAWLEAAGAGDTAPFGATTGVQLFFDKFLDELHDLLCSDEKYRAERSELLRSFKTGQATAVASITAAIAPSLSAAPPFLAPAIAVTLCVIGRAGLNAWCLSQSERRTSVPLNTEQ